jgi:hypothetical protein
MKKKPAENLSVTTEIRQLHTHQFCSSVNWSAFHRDVASLVSHVVGTVIASESQLSLES